MFSDRTSCWSTRSSGWRVGWRSRSECWAALSNACEPPTSSRREWSESSSISVRTSSSSSTIRPQIQVHHREFVLDLVIQSAVSHLVSQTHGVLKKARGNLEVSCTHSVVFWLSPAPMTHQSTLFSSVWNNNRQITVRWLAWKACLEDQTKVSVLGVSKD